MKGARFGVAEEIRHFLDRERGLREQALGLVSSDLFEDLREARLLLPEAPLEGP